MSVSLLAACALYALALAAWSLLRAVAGRPPDGLPALGAVMLAGMQIIVAVIAAVTLLAGAAEPDEPASAWGYLAATAALLPITFALREDENGWDSVILALGCIALAVADWRLTLVWGR